MWIYRVAASHYSEREIGRDRKIRLSKRWRQLSVVARLRSEESPINVIDVWRIVGKGITCSQRTLHRSPRTLSPNVLFVESHSQIVV